MRVHPDPFTVDMEKGSNCSVSVLKDTNNITEYQFTLSWTAENAAAEPDLRFPGKIVWMA